jgi:predicted DCC family thiol-disulfide oxidoreductase YuxK
MDNPIILFDGVCNLCNRSVAFVIKRDHECVFRFAPLQSDAGQELLRRFNLPTDTFDTMVLVEGATCYTKSTAGLRILYRLGRPWSLLYSFILVPRFLRDSIYRIIVHNRYKWWGKRESCPTPGPDVRARFLQ